MSNYVSDRGTIHALHDTGEHTMCGMATDENPDDPAMPFMKSVPPQAITCKHCLEHVALCMEINREQEK